MDSSLKEKWMKERAVGERNRICRTQQRACVESLINYPQSRISQDRFDYAVVTNNSEIWLKTTFISCYATEQLCVVWGLCSSSPELETEVDNTAALWKCVGSCGRGKRKLWRASVSAQKSYFPSAHSWLARTNHVITSDTKNSRKSLLPMSLAGGRLGIFWWMKLMTITKGKKKPKKLQKIFQMYSFILDYFRIDSYPKQPCSVLEPLGRSRNSLIIHSFFFNRYLLISVLSCVRHWWYKGVYITFIGSLFLDLWLSHYHSIFCASRKKKKKPS